MIKNIKLQLSELIGREVTVFYYGSRNKKECYNGVIYKLYNNVFIIKLLTGEVKSFSYIDIFTKTVKICV